LVSSKRRRDRIQQQQRDRQAPLRQRKQGRQGRLLYLKAQQQVMHYMRQTLPQCNLPCQVQQQSRVGYKGRVML
jgi:hypothetical protein